MTRDEFLHWWFHARFAREKHRQPSTTCLEQQIAWHAYLRTFGTPPPTNVREIPDDRLDEFASTYALLFE